MSVHSANAGVSFIKFPSIRECVICVHTNIMPVFQPGLHLIGCKLVQLTTCTKMINSF